VKVNESQVLYENSGFWKNSINVANILNISHRFREDPKYAEILKEIEDGDKISERLLKQKVQLLS
jgi:hypothetical protein